MNPHKEAAIEFLSRRKAGVKAPRLDTSIRPKTIDDVLAIHAEMAKIETTVGWKCLLPPSPEKIVAAPIFNLQQDTQEIALFAESGEALIEPEIAFVLGKDLPERNEDYSESELFDAIASAHMALELMQRRYAPDAGQQFVESLADGMINQGMFVGPEIDKDLAINASEITIQIHQGDDIKSLDGKHPNPRAVDGLLWLVNYLTKRGVSFKAGQAIITGSFKGIVNVAFDLPTHIAYEGIGEYDIVFKERI